MSLRRVVFFGFGFFRRERHRGCDVGQPGFLAMKLLPSLATGLVTATLALAMPLPSHAAGTRPHAPTAVQLAFAKAIGNFKLTENFLQRDHAVALALAKNPCGHGNVFAPLKLAGEVGKGQLTLDQAVKQYAALPGMRALLAKHGLSAREAFIGGFALMTAKMQVMAHKAQAHGAKVSASGPDTPTGHANVAFLKAHWPEVKAYDKTFGNITTQKVKANGGHMPACEKQMLGSPHGAHGNGGTK